MLLIGAPPAGYAIGAGAWIVLRAANVGVDRVTAEHRPAAAQIGLRLGSCSVGCSPSRSR